ncbi:MAG: hypothetical protein QOI85_141 [Chloroflexota bacterium]|nr:hypothetical protein [Chloroflexota bacterium]
MEVETTMTRRIAPPLAALALTLAACGGGGGGGGDEGADNPTTAEVEAGAERVAQPLAPGRYRLTITEDCEDYTVKITQESGPPAEDGQPFTYEKSNSPIRIVFVNDLPGGTFFIEQTNPDCTDWKLALARVSGG